jgi:hypothetical protein
MQQMGAENPAASITVGMRSTRVPELFFMIYWVGGRLQRPLPLFPLRSSVKSFMLPAPQGAASLNQTSNETPFLLYLPPFV